jgi:hypothetical protein
MRPGDLEISIDFKKALMDQVQEKVEQGIYKKVTAFKDELYNEADKIAAQIVPIYTEEVLRNIAHFIKDDDESVIDRILKKISKLQVYGPIADKDYLLRNEVLSIFKKEGYDVDYKPSKSAR